MTLSSQNQPIARQHLPWRRLAALLRPERQRMAAGIAVASLSSLSGIGLLAVSGHFITSMALVGVGGAAINYYTPAALIRLLAILRTGGRYAERLLTHDATLSMLGRLRVWLFARLVPLAPARLGRAHSAELLSRLRGDVDTLEQAYLGLLLPTVVAIVSSLSILLITVCYLPLLALTLTILYGLAGIVLPAWLQARNADAAAEVDQSAETLRLQIADALQGRAELALFGAEDAFEASIQATVTRREYARQRSQRRRALGDTALITLAALAMVATLFIGLPALHAGALSGPNLAMLVLLSMAGFEPLLPVPAAWAQREAIRAAAQRIFDLADTQPVIVDPAVPSTPGTTHDLSCRDVWLRYDDQPEWALDGLNLELPAGHHLAIVGPSGVGKSSLAQVLGRLYPYQGSIRLGGVPLASMAADEVRARVAIVEQHPYLFDASLRDNLCLACANASDEALRDVLAQVQLDAFVDALPHGLDSWIGANGCSVSGGELRRLAIARALLADAPILVLDEPCEGLDTLTAAALYRSLAVLTRGRSVLLITHRLDALELLVDEVARMQAGRIVERLPVDDYLSQCRSTTTRDLEQAHAQCVLLPGHWDG